MTNEEWREEMQANQLALGKSQIALQEAMITMAKTLNAFIETTTRITETSNERLARTERNLDLLIAGILRDHKNGGTE